MLTIQSDASTKDKTLIQTPSMYNVVFMDDDTTSMKFVCDILELFFNKSSDIAYEQMMNIHTSGSSLLGTYTKDIAETKIDLTLNYGKDEGFSPTLKLIKI